MPQRILPMLPTGSTEITDTLSERGVEEVDETKEVVNPAWRQKDAQVRSLRQKLQSRQALYGRVELDSALQPDTVQRYQGASSFLFYMQPAYRQ